MEKIGIFYLIYNNKNYMINKTKLTITIDKTVLELLEKFCEEKYYNKSKLVNGLLKDFLKKEFFKK